MILPQDSAHAAITIGNSKFAIFAGLAFVEIDDAKLESGILLRPAEINCLTHTPGAPEPFDMSCALMHPGLIEAESIEEAASIVAEQIMTIKQRILDKQADDNAEKGVCCGGHEGCQHEPQDGIPADATA